MKNLVYVMDCEPWINPHDSKDRLCYLSVRFTEYTLSSLSETCPPFHMTDTYVEPHVHVGC